MSSKLRLWSFGIFALVFISVGFFLGKYFFFNGAATPAATDNRLADNSVRNENKLSGSDVSFTGKITALVGTADEPGTHKLVDAGGKTLAYLESRKIDLDFIIPGVSVEVRGVISKRLGGGVALVDVQSLRYRGSSE